MNEQDINELYTIYLRTNRSMYAIKDDPIQDTAEVYRFGYITMARTVKVLLEELAREKGMTLQEVDVEGITNA